MASHKAKEITLSGWEAGEHVNWIMDQVAETGEDITENQVRAIIKIAREAGDTRAVRRNRNAVYVGQGTFDMKAYFLGEKSRAELKGVHPDLAAVTVRAIEITKQDFGVHDGLRTKAEQREYVRRGVSKTMNSRHLKQPDGFGHAVDLVPYVNGKLRWEWEPIYEIASAVHTAANELGVKLRWGGVWDRVFNDLREGPDGLKRAVSGYVARRRAKRRSAFIDGPHYELKV